MTPMSPLLKAKYRPGDVVEFFVYNINGGKRTPYKYDGEHVKWVGRITDVMYNDESGNRDGIFEYWMEYLCEVMSCGPLLDEDIIRVIEESDLEPMIVMEPPIALGTTVVHEEGTEKIEKYSQCQLGIVSHKFSYIMENSGYQMSEKEFNVLRTEEYDEAIKTLKTISNVSCSQHCASLAINFLEKVGEWK